MQGNFCRLLRNNATIECTLNCEQIYLDIDTAIPIGLIANEMFINAYKYAFNDLGGKGEIRVQLIQQPDKRYVLLSGITASDCQVISRLKIRRPSD
jgi:two-component sensor histidine kinase